MSKIGEKASEWATDYKPWDDGLPPHEYARYGYEEGYKQAVIDYHIERAIKNN